VSTFEDAGYCGLYGGLNAADLRRRKGLPEKEPLVDRMGSTELAANLFQATQTEEKLRRDEIGGKEAANRTHEEVGRRVRQAIQEVGGIMPEDLCMLEISVRKLENEESKRLGGGHE
jgi:DNA-damage-inducible protein D